MLKFVLRLSIAFTLCLCCTAAVLSSAHLPLEARDADGSSEEEEVISNSYVLPNQIFNNGKPYYASKDPVSGQLDFNIKKPAGIDSTVNEVIDPNEKAIITSSSPNIHDFLNLPVKYSSSKFVYPLVSSSYANLKYQGSNKNYISKQKPTHVVQATLAPNYHTANYYTVPTTKLTPVAPTTPALTSTSSTTTSTTTTTTTKKPTTASTSSSTSTTPTSTSTSTTSTSTTSTTKAPIVQTLVSVQSSSSSQKYTTSTRRPTQSTSTVAPKTSTTRKKFIPNKKYTPTPPQTTSTAMRFPEQGPLNTTALPRPTTTSVFSNQHPTQPSSTKNTYPTTLQPVVFTEDPLSPPPFSPFPSSTHIPNLEPADVYHTLDQKNTENKFEQKPSMTLADIFNSLAEEESAVAANNPMHQGLDAQGNLMVPLDPSKPSPFAMHNAEAPRQPQPTNPTLGTTVIPQNPLQQQHLQSQQTSQQHQQPAVISGSQETFSNEYVSYQVQQPNIMQYRPAPGAINNVVISPGQNSASLVLGSQQQVGQNAFGSVEKEPLFSKDHPVQYGQVISEDISGISRQPVPNAPSPYQEMPNPSPISNFHQNGNFATKQEQPKRPELQRPLPPVNNYQELPPAPPSPYQQLPLIGNIRNKPNNPAHQKPLSPPPPPPSQNQAIPSSNPIGSIQSVSPQDNGDSSITLGSQQNTKELLVSTNIRFPANEEHSIEIPSLPVANGPPAGPQVNGHAQPLSLQQIQNSNTVVFPKQEDGKPQQNEIIYHNTPNSNADGVQIQKHEVLTMSQHQQKLTFPPANEPNTPAQHMIPPPLPNSIGSEHELQKPNRPHGGPQYAYNEYTRKPIPGITRPNPDRHLPNILPQFRPNAKISSGHPQQANFNQEPGNIRVTGPQQPMRGPINGNPQFSHRRQPLGGQPKRYPLTRMAEYPAGLPSPNEMANRRVYRVPPYGGAGVQYLDRPGMHVRRPLPHNLRPAESMNVERHALAPALEKLPAFEEEDLVIDDPPQPVAPSKEANLFSEAKLEPVVTLQMLQSQKKAVSLPSDDSGDGEIQVPSLDNDETEEVGAQDNQNGLYVVYPIKGAKKSENIEDPENQNVLPAVAHMEPPTGSEYQNTPFSIIRDHQQEPVLKNKKPLSLQQQNKAQQGKDSFPYPIEKPDPSYSELNSAPRVPGVVIAPKIRNGAYGLATEAPIAIAYTPTEPSRHQGLGNHQQQQQPQQQQQQQTMYSNINLATPVINEIRPDTQTEEALNGHDFDLRAQNYEKNFMAPFYPSVSLDSVTSTPTNGWNVLPSSTDNNLYEKNNIDRSDVGNGDNKSGEGVESATKSFELDKFQPELQGGFKPIYPPGYKLDNEQEEQEQLQQHETNNMPLALASRMEPPQKLQQLSEELKTSSSTSSTTTTTAKPLTDNENTDENLKLKPTEIPSATVKPTKRTKSKFETSLAALLFGEDEEDAVEADEPAEQTQARQEPTKAMMSGPRSIPRMGPRSLKI
ncbi:mucin-2 [Calliphora vicina]|uniref:mucin-2 n=1 Tax=Calliphora vicina TaxID=7373 RepID=UPI00325C1447